MQENKESSVVRRPATEADTDFARRVHHEAYRDLIIRRYGSWDEVAQDGFFEKSWSSGPHEIILNNDIPVGYVLVVRKPEELFISEILVLPEFQGKGIGTSVMRSIMKEGQDKHLPVRLQVFKENKAQHLYRKLGFKENAPTDSHLQMEFNPNA